MSKLSIELPPELFSALEESAKEIGVTPEELVSELVIPWLTEVITRHERDPLVKLFGSIQSDFPDWTEKHDEYLGQQEASGLGEAVTSQKSSSKGLGLTF